MNFHLEIDNPNDREFLVEKISYLVEMEDGKLTEGQILGPWKLRKKTVTSVELPVTFKTGDILDGIARVLEGKRELLLTGTISSKSLTVPFKTKKKIEL
ncbi:MAG: LEA type 2 family protein [Pseudobdellovibrionaceae bacterium]